MGKTKRNANRWMETRFKYGDSQYPEENESHYFNGRYQAKMRNGNHSYHSDKIDPRTYKISSWHEYDRDAKVMAKRAARHNAKILVRLEAFIIMDEIWQEYRAVMLDDDVWYEDGYMGFNYNYSDEALDYAYQRHQKEMIYEYGNDPYMDWDY